MKIFLIITLLSVPLCAQPLQDIFDQHDERYEELKHDYDIYHDIKAGTHRQPLPKDPEEKAFLLRWYQDEENLVLRSLLEKALDFYQQGYVQDSLLVAHIFQEALDRNLVDNEDELETFIIQICDRVWSTSPHLFDPFDHFLKTYAKGLYLGKGVPQDQEKAKNILQDIPQSKNVEREWDKEITKQKSQKGSLSKAAQRRQKAKKPMDYEDDLQEDLERDMAKMHLEDHDHSFSDKMKMFYDDDQDDANTTSAMSKNSRRHPLYGKDQQRPEMDEEEDEIDVIKKKHQKSQK